MNTFRMPLWYRIGVEIMLEALTGENVNMNTISRERASALLEEVYQPKYDQALTPILILLLF